MGSKRLLILLAAYFVSSCNSSITSRTQADNKAEDAVEEAIALDAKSGPKKPIDGFQNLKLGQSFEDAIDTVDSDLFNPISLKKCYDDFL